MSRQSRQGPPGSGRGLARRSILPWAVAASLVLTACSGGADATQGAGTPGALAAAAVDLGPEKAATGEPVVFGTLALETGPIAFPEARAAAQAAVSYVNAYRGGIGGRPIKLEHCITDATPATSARCANQLLDKRPTAILGTVDIGSPAAMPVWERADLAYLGGVTLTPVEQNSPNSIQFSSVSVADNASTAVFVGQTLKAKSVAVISGDSNQDRDIVNTRIVPVLKAAGVEKVTSVTYPLGAADLTSQMATALAGAPDVVYIASVSACVNAFRALATLGNTAKLAGISQCASQDNLDAVQGAADGLYYATPFQAPETDSPDAALYRTVMKKYAPDASLTNVAASAFSTVMNVHAALADKDPATLTTESILTTFRSGEERPNFLSHPYTCDGRQLAKAISVCDAHQLMYQVRKGRIAAVDGLNYITPGRYYVG